MIEAKGNIIGKLLSISAKEEQGTDFEKALRYPLYSVPLCLAHPDGSRRSSSKSKLLDIIITDPTSITETPTTIIREQSAFVLDMIAQIRSCITNLPDTYEEFILKFLQTIPKRFCRVDIVADCYRDNSIKSSERMKRGGSSKIIIGSVMSRLPRDTNKFLMNSTLFKRIFKYIIDKKNLCFANATN